MQYLPRQCHGESPKSCEQTTEVFIRLMRLGFITDSSKDDVTGTGYFRLPCLNFPLDVSCIKKQNPAAYEI